MKLLYSFHDFAGVVELVADYTVCTEGQNISPEASRILVLFSSCLGVGYIYLAYLGHIGHAHVL